MPFDGHTKPTWTHERVSLLRAMWVKGWPASVIARELGGVSRNAVIGKAHRIGLPGRKTPNRKVKPVRTRPVEAARKTPAPALKAKPGPKRASEPQSLELTIIEIGRHQCRWATGERSGQTVFCGHETTGTYCEHHARRAGRMHVELSEAERKARGLRVAQARRAAPDRVDDERG